MWALTVRSYVIQLLCLSYINDRKFSLYWGALDPFYLITWIPSLLIFSIYSIIVFLAVRSDNEKIWSISLGVCVLLLLLITTSGGLTEQATFIDYFYYYLDYCIPLIGSCLGTFVILRVKKA